MPGQGDAWPGDAAPAGGRLTLYAAGTGVAGGGVAGGGVAGGGVAGAAHVIS
jgi:hypothetical protein